MKLKLKEMYIKYSAIDPTVSYVLFKYFKLFDIHDYHRFTKKL